MATFVLVHGGWHGGWCWRAVARQLGVHGHEVIAPTLSGLAERAHLCDRVGVDGVDVGLHIDDIVGVLEHGNLREVVLVGHSYGGLVIAGVADRVAERIAQLVYLDAFVPEDGQALVDLLPAERRAYYEERAREAGGHLVPPPPVAALGITDEAQGREVEALLTLQPLATFHQPVLLPRGGAGAIPHAYVHCTQGPLAGTFAVFAERARAGPRWRYAELATGHDAMLTAPDDVAAALVALMTSAAGPEVSG